MESFGFEIDSDGYVVCYTDGSCLNNGKSNIFAGYGVFFGDGHQFNIGNPIEKNPTNNVAEIEAAIYAIQICKQLQIPKLRILTDSSYLINSVTLWMKKWKSCKWFLSNGNPVKNVEQFQKLDRLLSHDIQVKWEYVKAHSGIHGNEMADLLAKTGAELAKKNNNLYIL